MRSKNRILVIAPHPDDEVLGCGGTIARLSGQDYDVFILIVTRGYTPDWSEEFLKNRPKEIKKSHKILGVKKTLFLNYLTVKLDAIPKKELNDNLAEIIEQVKPDIVFIPHKGDLNHDHRIIFESSLVALRPTKWKVSKVFTYEVLSETEWGYEIAMFKPNVYYDITETFQVKIEAMQAYSSELREFPHPRSLEAIEALAKKRGSEIGVKYAEAFYLLREIIS